MFASHEERQKWAEVSKPVLVNKSTGE